MKLWFLKEMLTRIGSRLSAHTLHQFQVVVYYMKAGRWMANHNFRFERRVRDRFAVFDAVAKQVHDKRVLYLEFGVYQGNSMRYWCRELKHPEAKLHGFDSFEGLPEDYDLWTPKGSFCLQGEVPVIDDPRVQLFDNLIDDGLHVGREVAFARLDKTGRHLVDVAEELWLDGIFRRRLSSAGSDDQDREPTGD